MVDGLTAKKVENHFRATLVQQQSCAAAPQPNRFHQQFRARSGLSNKFEFAAGVVARIKSRVLGPGGVRAHPLSVRLLARAFVRIRGLVVVSQEVVHLV
jgi:hypothetical protein